MPWYVYTSGDPSINTNYVSAGTGFPSCEGSTLCAVYAQPGGGGLPLITQGIYSAAQEALDGNITEGVTLLRPE